MKGSNAAVATSPAKKGGLTAEEAKARVYERGMTLKEFAAAHKVPYRTVSEVLRGVNKGLFGQGHKAAVALGMKRGA